MIDSENIQVKDNTMPSCALLKHNPHLLANQNAESLVAKV